MRFLGFDAETLYCTKTGYTLSKMTAEEYVRDERFELIGFSIAPMGGNAQWYSGDLPYLRSVAQSIDWGDIFVVGHNMSSFDSLILTEVLQVRPAAYGCTLQLARCLNGSKTPDGKNISNALGSLAKMYQREIEQILGRSLFKGDEVIRADGKRRLDFTPDELAAYGRYCNDDVALCNALWQVLSPQFPKSELLLASTVTKMWAEPRLVLDGPLLGAMGVEIAQRKAELLGKVANMLGVGTTMDPAERMFHTQKLLRSDAKFAELLQQYDVDIPMKRSPKKRDAEGKAMEVYAFAKTDSAMTDLLEYEASEDEATNEAVQALAAARLGTKSTQAESRVQRLHGIATRGPLTVALEYGKTLTGRLSGGGRTNLQNLNQIKGLTKKTPNGALIMTPAGWSRLFKRAPDMSQIMDSERRIWATQDCHVVGLRDTIMAPPGYKIVACDSSTIELRVAHWLCGQDDTIQQLKNGEDLYCSFSSTLYGRTITKADKKERQHGKVAMLQLQYQAGAESFRRAARLMGGVRLTEMEAQATVDIYRAKYPQIKQQWYTGQKSIPKCASGGGFYLDPRGLLFVEHNSIRLPNGMPIKYHNLRLEEVVGFDGLPEMQWRYDDKETRAPKKTYGGMFGVQNPTQALAALIVMTQQSTIERALQSRRWGGVVLSVHDEVVACVKEDYAEDALEFMVSTMKLQPQWAGDLPLGAEGAIGSRYSDCK